MIMIAGIAYSFELNDKTKQKLNIQIINFNLYEQF